METDFTNALRNRLNKSAVPIQAVLLSEEGDVPRRNEEDVLAGKLFIGNILVKTKRRSKHDIFCHCILQVPLVEQLET